jgi:ubiquitin thioesterase OTU1
LDSGATTRDLRGLITEKTGLAHFDVKYGYPPKPLHLGSGSLFLSELGIDLNGEQLTVSALDGPDVKERPSKDASERSTPVKAAASPSPARTGDPFFPSDKISLAGIRGEGTASKDHARHTGTKPDPIALSRKTRELEVPELPMPDRGATMGE